MTARIFIGDRQVDAIPEDSRGLAYGDGVFETMRMHRGVVHWWDAHWRRLAQGAARFRIPLPDASMARDHAAQLCGNANGVLKLMLTRGAGARGYAPGPGAAPLWLLSQHSLPARPRTDGLILRWCDTRLAIQPALAGLKHCNRLEQVIARGEWQDNGIDDGLMCDSEGFVVSATSANLFVLRDGRWLTPAVDRSGVAGICRAWCLQETTAHETRLTATDVESSDAVFLCNAVRGILPVARLHARAWSSHPDIADLQARLARAHPAFASDREVS
ncbi:MAG: aminodeoxychorismate lyase [Pseudomonadota bacterium]|nr:aminodeoxychorismate lyase [Pseudomonadota bacterium]MDQ3230123.1 aminodeoxychorismate lyase [Pseudomonadota bacterium]